MTHQEIRQKFLNFFKEQGHAIVPSSSLLPTDPSVLFATAGMQQFKPYYTGQADAQKDFGSLNTCSIQKSMRTSDIDEVGDESHLTFFEMMGNFSFGGYFKEDAIKLAYEFITEEMGLAIDYVTVFDGEGDIPTDIESEKIWKKIDSKILIKKFGQADNFWGPTGDEGPCGPTTEIYVNGVEIWNIVFNQFYKNKSGQYTPLEIPGIDTGMGLERLAAIVQKKGIFETDLLGPIYKLTPPELDVRIKKIITDHSRSIAFLITDGVRPSNKEQGYVLRRLMRRTINYVAKSDATLMPDIFAKTVEIYGQNYPHLDASAIIYEFDHEKEKFNKTLAQGLKELERISDVNADSAFKLYESYGLPFEIIKDIAGAKAEKLTREAFEEKFKKHQEKSRAGAEKKFGGHGLLLDTGELKAANEEEIGVVTRLHTATHLLQASLRKVLGPEVKQAGSDITAERLRFDFTFSRKLTPDEIKKTEDLVNEIIKKDLAVTKKEMLYEEALQTGALNFFKLKYPSTVNVYTVGPGSWNNPSSSDFSGPPFSRELCGGPHVTHTGEIGHFKIKKEETVGAGVRRIRAIAE